MNKVIPLIGIAVASIFAGRAVMQLSDLPITNPAATAAGSPPELQPKASAEPQTTRGDGEPPHKAIIRCLGDLDDLLDTISGPAAFQAVKPIMLGRVRQFADRAAEHSNRGMAKLSRAASKEMQTAMNRHAQAVTRANSVAPGVTRFFEHEVASVLKPQ